MENHKVQCAKTILVRNVFSFSRIRKPSDMHGTINVFLTTIHGPDHNSWARKDERGGEKKDWYSSC